MAQRLSQLKPRPVMTAPSESELQRWIAEAAYYRAQRRGFQPGGETRDWLAAEAEILSHARV